MAGKEDYLSRGEQALEAAALNAWRERQEPLGHQSSMARLQEEAALYGVRPEQVHSAIYGSDVDNRDTMPEIDDCNAAMERLFAAIDEMLAEGTQLGDEAGELMWGVAFAFSTQTRRLARRAGEIQSHLRSLVLNHDGSDIADDQIDVQMTRAMAAHWRSRAFDDLLDLASRYYHAYTGEFWMPRKLRAQPRGALGIANGRFTDVALAAAEKQAGRNPELVVPHGTRVAVDIDPDFGTVGGRAAPMKEGRPGYSRLKYGQARVIEAALDRASAEIADLVVIHDGHPAVLRWLTGANVASFSAADIPSGDDRKAGMPFETVRTDALIEVRRRGGANHQSDWRRPAILAGAEVHHIDGVGISKFLEPGSQDHYRRWLQKVAARTPREALAEQRAWLHQVEITQARLRRAIDHRRQQARETGVRPHAIAGYSSVLAQATAFCRHPAVPERYKFILGEILVRDATEGENPRLFLHGPAAAPMRPQRRGPPTDGGEDMRPVWDRDRSIRAARLIYEALCAITETGTQLESERSSLLWHVTNSAHHMLDRLERRFGDKPGPLLDAVQELTDEMDRQYFGVMREAFSRHGNRRPGARDRTLTGACYEALRYLDSLRDNDRLKTEALGPRVAVLGPVHFRPGGRDEPVSRAFVVEALEQLLDKHPDLVAVTPGGNGVAAIVRSWARARHVEVIECPLVGDRSDTSRGFNRNARMARVPGLKGAVYFETPKPSHLVHHMREQMIARKVPVWDRNEIAVMEARRREAEREAAQAAEKEAARTADAAAAKQKREERFRPLSDQELGEFMAAAGERHVAGMKERPRSARVLAPEVIREMKRLLESDDMAEDTRLRLRAVGRALASVRPGPDRTGAEAQARQRGRGVTLPMTRERHAAITRSGLTA